MRLGTACMLAAALLLGACGNETITSDPLASPTTTTTTIAEVTTTTITEAETTTTTTAAPRMVEMPMVVGSLLNMARSTGDEAGVSIDGVDVGHLLLGNGAQRGIFEPANWWVIAQCVDSGQPLEEGTRVEVAVIKSDEVPDEIRSMVGHGTMPQPLGC